MRIRGRSGIAMLLCVSSLLLLSVLPNIEVQLDTSVDFDRGPAINGSPDEWHFFQKNLKHTGRADSNGPLDNSTIWVATHPRRWASGSMSYANGIIYLPNGIDGVQALNASTGDVLWTVPVDSGGVHATPAYYEGAIYFGTMWGNGTFYAVNASSGSILWERHLNKDEYTASPIVVDGIVYVPTAWDGIVALDASNGSTVWEVPQWSYLHTSPAYDAGVLFHGHWNMRATDAATGSEIWVNKGPNVRSSIVLAGGKVCGHGTGYVVCLDKTNGTEVWRSEVGTPNAWSGIQPTPAILGKRLFVGTQDGWAYALDLDDGSILWNVTIGERKTNSILASPVVAPNGVVYFANEDIYTLSAVTGDILWSFKGFCPGISRSTPMLVNSVLYAQCSQKGPVYAFGGSVQSPPQIQDITIGPNTPVMEGAPFSISVDFIDYDPNDTHTAFVDFSYGPNLTAAVEEQNMGDHVAGSFTVNHTYGDNGNFSIIVGVMDSGGALTTKETFVDVLNVDPDVELAVSGGEDAVDVALRIAGEKWHDATVRIFEEEDVVRSGTIMREPGSPNEQTLWFEDLQMNRSRTYATEVVYTPLDDEVNGQVWGATPAWLLFYSGGTEVARLHHVFNVRDEETWTWRVDDLSSQFPQVAEYTVFLNVTDPGSDDLTIRLELSTGLVTEMVVYSGVGPDPYPSPEVKPTALNWVSELTIEAPCVLRVEVLDDDGGLTELVHYF